jgi:signal transduction histidine kinase
MQPAARTRTRWLPDVVLAAGVTVAQLLLVRIAAGSSPSWRAPSAVTLGLVLVQSLPLVVRQLFPVPVFALVLGGNVVYYLLGYPPTGLDVALVVALYTVAAHRSGRFAAVALAVCVASVVGPALVGWGPFWSRATPALVAYLMVFFVAGYAAGRYQQVRRLFDEERLQSLAERARREREVAEVLAVKAERTRIARELHDSVAHLLSVVAVQASAAASQLERDHDGARRALDAVREASRQGLATMPSIVRALRAEEPEVGERSWSPPETLADLPAAVDRLHRAGCAVDLRMDMTTNGLPPGVSESAFRVAQEALTNAVKYAPRAPISVCVTEDGDAVTVDVVNDEPPESPPAPAAGGGYGLVGMRERVSLFGGTFIARPRDGGGFEVRARFPIGGRAAS